MEPDKKSPLLEIYDRLVSHFGPSHWWPGETPLEIMVGAILTQNTSWNNVERTIEGLKMNGALSASFLNQVDEVVLSEWIRSTGYYRIKAKRLKNFFKFFISEYQGLTKNMQDQPLKRLRHQLLQVNGIGPETADSILLYALGMPTFVVDAYTHRIFSRHQLIDEEISYEDLQAYFMDHLPAEPQLYNEYHALLVRLGKEFCRKKNPRCQECPLKIEGERI
jgi:endonuclease III related protein